MFLARSFEIVNVIGIAMIVERRIVIRIVAMWVVVRLVIWEIANAAPVRDFWIRKSVTNEIDMTIVLIEPSRVRNCSRFSLPVISEPMIAAWDEPSPGKKEQIGEINIVDRVGFISSFFESENFSIFCLGIVVFVLMELIIVDAPNSPVKSGRSGCWMLRLNVDIPRNPASTKIIVALILDSFSWRINKIAIQIRNRPSILSTKG